MTQGKTEVAHRDLREKIISGRFPAGYRLVLADHSSRLGMSVVPVREALRRLEAEGLVTFERNVGARVALIDPEAYHDTMQALAVVEGAATGLAAARLGPDRIAAARDINARLAATLTDFDPGAFNVLNQEFHRALYADCPNTDLLEAVDRCWTRLVTLRDSIFSLVPGRAASSVREHEEILELIESGAGALDIELAVRRHRTATLDAVLAHRQAEDDDARPANGGS